MNEIRLVDQWKAGHPNASYEFSSGETLTIFATCSSDCEAQELWEQRHLLAPLAPVRLFLYVGSVGFSTTLIDKDIGNLPMGAAILPGDSTWIRQNEALFSSLPGLAFVHSSSRDRGYPYLGLMVTDTRRLNRPPAELLNNPIAITNEAIAIPKISAITEALELGGPVRYTYEYRDHLHWLFEVTVAPTDIEGEVLVLVDDHESRRREQRWYWENLVTA